LSHYSRLLSIVQMNEQADDERFGSNFFQSFFDQAREKTMSTLALVKRDLVELGETFQQEASSLITVTANVIREHAPPLNAEVASNWMKAVVDSVSYVLSEKDTAVGEEEFEIPIVAPLDNGKYDSVRALQMDPETFCTDPEGATELYEDWKSNFNLRHYEEECKEIFRNCPSVRRMYLQLVPNEIDSIQFWQRYFYRVHQHQLDKARKRYFADEQLFAEKKNKNDWISQEMPGDLSQTGLMQSVALSDFEEYPTDDVEHNSSTAIIASSTSDVENHLVDEMRCMETKLSGPVCVAKHENSQVVADEEESKSDGEIHLVTSSCNLKVREVGDTVIVSKE
ncbi:BSD domain-containing protein 1, partial [Trichinella britovi]